MSPLARRTVLLGLGGTAVGAATVGAAARLAGWPRWPFGEEDPTAGIPTAAEGEVRLEQRDSLARNQSVGFFTAVPAGHGDGTGLPICLVLHGASATTADYRRFGLARFLTAAVEAGVPPFVLAGADGGRSFWRGSGPDDDPLAMLREELPAWCAERGFDASRIALYGWSMGGYGALAYAQAAESSRSAGQGAGAAPGLRAVAALSPAVSRGDQVFADVDLLAQVPVGLWCGLDDALLADVQALADAMRPPPVTAAWQPGRHVRGYWNRVTPAAFALVGERLGQE